MGAAIEAPLALFQIPITALFADPVEPAHVPFGLVPKVFDAVDVMATCGDECLTVVHPPVTELGDIKGVIRREAVGLHDAIGLNSLPDNGHECLGFGIGDDGGHHVPSAF